MISAGRRRGASSADQGTSRPPSRRRSVRKVASSLATSAGDVRSRRSTASACGRRLCPASQRGLSGSTSMPMASIVPGTAPNPSIQRQPSGVVAKAYPTR